MSGVRFQRHGPGGAGRNGLYSIRLSEAEPMVALQARPYPCAVGAGGGAVDGRRSALPEVMASRFQCEAW
jgi:hypothetical protein